MNIPDWMLGASNIVEEKKRPAKARFLLNSLLSISKVIYHEVFSESYALRKKLMQGIDPRVKLVTILFFIVCCGLTKSLLTLLFLTFAASMYVWLSGLSLKDYLSRVWMIYPLFLLIVSVPAATNFFIPGKPALYVYQALALKLWSINFPPELYFSYEGLAAISKMAVRVGVSFSFGYILVMTTRWSHLTKSLSFLHVPLQVIAILNMTYRYIYVIAKISMEMLESRWLRTVGKISRKDNRSFIAGRISFLFVKAYFLSGEIYEAMRCRGYTGEPVCLNSFKLRRADYFWLSSNLIIVLVIVMGEIIF
ncbi:MAG: Nickel transport protein NikQ [Pelotomaculum sp. PtaB.Bin104]|nr:MAG: Nickel transport protein NikQ [Pelotomaculum sp. PtaB.Bin104]